MPLFFYSPFLCYVPHIIGTIVMIAQLLMCFYSALLEQRYGNSCCLPAKDVIMKCLSAVSPCQYGYYEKHVSFCFFLLRFGLGT